MAGPKQPPWTKPSLLTTPGPCEPVPPVQWTWQSGPTAASCVCRVQSPGSWGSAPGGRREALGQLSVIGGPMWPDTPKLVSCQGLPRALLRPESQGPCLPLSCGLCALRWRHCSWASEPWPVEMACHGPSCGQQLLPSHKEGPCRVSCWSSLGALPATRPPPLTAAQASEGAPA